MGPYPLLLASFGAQHVQTVHHLTGVATWPGAIMPPGVQGPASTRCGSEITAAPQRVCSTHPGCSKWLADTRNGVCVNYTWDHGIYARVMRGGGKESVCG